jgi:hypothetical protein
MTDMTVPADNVSVEIPPEPPKKEYLNPYWSNKENRHLIVTIKFPNGKTSTASIQDTDGSNPDMKEIMKVYTEEDIDANTQKGLDARNEKIRKHAERKESQKARAKQEALFAIKLEMFEIDTIKNSENKELKRRIRKAKTIPEAQAYCTILLMKELENESK